MVSEYFRPCGNATGHIMTTVAELLANRRNVGVLTTTPPGNEQEPAVPQVIRIPDVALDKNRLLQRLLRILLLSWRLFRAILKNVKRGDVVLSVTNPTALTLLLALGRSMRGYRVALIVHDVFPENLVPTGILSKNNPLYLLTRAIFNLALNRFDAILVIGRDMEAVMKSKIRNHRRIHCIPNFGDTMSIQPMPRSESPIIRELGLENKLILLLTGNIGRAQDIPFIREAMLQLKGDPAIHFLFIGDGALKPALEAFIRENELRNCTLHAAMPRSRENDFLNAGDIGLVLLAPGFKGLGVPSKTYSYLAAGKPVISLAEAGSETDLLVNEDEVGWSLHSGQVREFCELVKTLASDRIELKEIGLRARKICEEKYTPGIYAGKVGRIIDELLKTNER